MGPSHNTWTLGKYSLSIDKKCDFINFEAPHRAKYLDTKLRYRSKLCKVIAFVLLLPWKQIILVKFVVVSTIYKLVYHVLKLIGYHDVLMYVQYCQCCQIRTNFINSGLKKYRCYKVKKNFWYFSKDCVTKPTDYGHPMKA